LTASAGQTAAAPAALPPADARELVLTWAKCIAIIAAAALVPWGPLRANLAGVAAFVFIALPDNRLRVRHEHWDEYGLPWWGWRDPRTWRAWARGLAIALVAAALILPPFFAAFWGYSQLVPALPPGLAKVVAPYGALGDPRWPGFPPDLWKRIVVQLLVVALPEELFYRGWMQTTWARLDRGRGVRVLGARLGPGFLWTQLLFALGHLVVLQPWRIATFFPALVFGWLRERTGNLAAPVLFHALSNLWIFLLEASFYGAR
jgi:membrane protease YdiL (CAAX protease family)